MYCEFTEVVQRSINGLFHKEQSAEGEKEDEPQRQQNERQPLDIVLSCVDYKNKSMIVYTRQGKMLLINLADRYQWVEIGEKYGYKFTKEEQSILSIHTNNQNCQNYSIFILVTPFALILLKSDRKNEQFELSFKKYSLLSLFNLEGEGLINCKFHFFQNKLMIVSKYQRKVFVSISKILNLKQSAQLERVFLFNNIVLQTKQAQEGNEMSYIMSVMRENHLVLCKTPSLNVTLLLYDLEKQSRIVQNNKLYANKQIIIQKNSPSFLVRQVKFLKKSEKILQNELVLIFIQKNHELQLNIVKLNDPVQTLSTISYPRLIMNKFLWSSFQHDCVFAESEEKVLENFYVIIQGNRGTLFSTDSEQILQLNTGISHHAVPRIINTHSLGQVDQIDTIVYGEGKLPSVLCKRYKQYVNKSLIVNKIDLASKRYLYGRIMYKIQPRLDCMYKSVLDLLG